MVVGAMRGQVRCHLAMLVVERCIFRLVFVQRLASVVIAKRGMGSFLSHYVDRSFVLRSGFLGHGLQISP